MKTKKLLSSLVVSVLCLICQSAQAQFVSVTNAVANGVAHSTFFLTPTTGFIAGESAGFGVIQRTTDAGQTWTNVYTSTANLEWVNDIFFVNSTTGYAVGVSGSILKSTNGGLNWTRQVVSNVTQFHAVFFINAGTGFAVGDGNPEGPIFKTVDGGSSWTPQTSGATSFLNDVYFTSTLVGYAVGDKEVLKTINGGNAWTNVSPSSTHEKTSVFCENANTCYTTGALLEKTNDGGGTWNSLALPSVTPPLIYFTKSVQFTDQQTGFAVGAKLDTTNLTGVGTILKTTNAGVTWTNINTAANNTALTNKFLESVYFVDTQNGFAAGSDGIVLKTTNAGTLPCNLALSVSVTNATCGSPTGTATVVATNGAGPYTYQWTNGDNGVIADSLASGLYQILVTDANGCTKNAPAMISDAGSPTITVTSTTSVSCNGGNNGSIDISVAGGTGPYTYDWVNGATTQDVTGLSAGPYHVEVTGNNGCMAMANITVSEPAQLTVSVSINNATCGSPNGTATAIPSGGSTPYSYLWSTVPSQTTATATGLSAGGYSVTVTDVKGCTTQGMAPIVNSGGAVVAVDSVKAAGCATGLGSIYISVTNGTPPYTYAWSNGATTQDLTNVPDGPYSLTVYSNGNPCTGAFMGVVPSQQPAAPSICMVTVDTITDKNVCIFEKDSVANLGIAYYKFYRESTVAGQYQFLGSKASTLPSQWTDQSANPLQHSWRYKISAVDTCGNESPISSYHKTIHLSANVSVSNHVNLMWDDYEGFSVPTFIIYRFTWATGWDSLDAVSGNVHSYTDFSITGPFTDVYYYVAVVNPNSCEVSSKDPLPESANLNLSKSNINKLGPTPTGMKPTYTTGPAVQVFPNPTTGEFRVQSSRFKTGKCEVLDVMGRTVLAENLDNGTLNMDLSGELNGIYFLKIVNEGETVTKKIVLQK